MDIKSFAAVSRTFTSWTVSDSFRIGCPVWSLLVYFFFQMYVYWLLHSALWFDISWFKLRNFLLRLQLDKLRQWVNELLINTLKRTCLTGYVITSVTRFCFDWCVSKNFYHRNWTCVLWLKPPNTCHLHYLIHEFSSAYCIYFPDSV